MKKERLKKIGQLFEKIIEEFIYELEEKFTQIERKLNNLVEDIIEENKKLTNRIDKLEGEIQKLNKIILNSQKDIEKNFKIVNENILKGNNNMLDKIDDMFNKIKEIFNFNKENQELKNLLNKIEEENKQLKNRYNELEKEKNDLSKKITILEKDNKEKNEEIESLKQNFSNLKEKEKQYNKLKTEILQVSPLLEVILRNNSLIKFREDFNINKSDDISLLNLYSLVANKENFINTIYKYIEEFKQKTPLALDENEIYFYEKINEYFKEEIFKDIYSTLKDDEFDKRKHRGINGEIRGELDDSKAVLIPYCKIGDKKMRVKLKKQ